MLSYDSDYVDFLKFSFKHEKHLMVSLYNKIIRQCAVFNFSSIVTHNQQYDLCLNTLNSKSQLINHSVRIKLENSTRVREENKIK